MNQRAPFSFPAVPAAVATTLAAATVSAGGSQAIAKRLGLPALQVAQWMNGQDVLPAEHCPVIEEMSGTRCEDLRPDLYWIRAGGELLGFLAPVDSADAEYVKQAIRNEVLAAHYSAPHEAELIDGKWQADAYVAGIMHGMDADAAAKLLAEHYRGESWTRAKLNSLAADVDDICDQSSALIYCMGMLRGVDDADHDRVLEMHKPRGWGGWTEQMSDAVWGEAEAIRQRNGKQSVLAATKGGEEPIPVHGAVLNLLVEPDASIENCLCDGLAYLDAAIAAGMEKADDFDQTMWASYHLLSLSKGLLSAAQDKLYAFNRQQATT